MRVLGLVLLCLSAGLSGCASIPSSEYRYAPSAGIVNVTIVQSLACSKDKKRLVISDATPTIATTYQPDTSGGPWAVKIAKDGSDTVDTDFTLTTWDGLRLKSVNSTNTGEGEAVLKDVVTIGVGLAAVVGADPAHPVDTSKVCAEIDNLNKDGVISITYAAQASFSQFSAANHWLVPVLPTDGSKSIYDDLNGMYALDNLAMRLTLLPYDAQPAVPQVTTSHSRDYYWLPIQKVQLGKLEILRSGTSIASSQVAVGDTDRANAWMLPIPKPKPFGKSTFALSVAESGAVTSIQYAKTSGSPGVFNVVNAGVGAIPGNTAADKLANEKLQDDIMAENARNTLCLAQPSTCK